jgi:hypothetical protein
MAKVSGTFSSPLTLFHFPEPLPLYPIFPSYPPYRLQTPNPPNTFCIEFRTNPSPNRKELKRSHTLRYVLKNRASGQVLFVVLFTLYLKEDIDEEGNVKPGVLEEANKPFELRDEDAKKRHGKKGWWWSGGDGPGDEVEDEDGEEENEPATKESKENGKVENGKAVETTNDDDVD